MTLYHFVLHIHCTSIFYTEKKSKGATYVVAQFLEKMNVKITATSFWYRLS